MIYNMTGYRILWCITLTHHLLRLFGNIFGKINFQFGCQFLFSFLGQVWRHLLKFFQHIIKMPAIQPNLLKKVRKMSLIDWTLIFVNEFERFDTAIIANCLPVGRLNSLLTVTLLVT